MLNRPLFSQSQAFHALLEVGVISTDGSDDPCQPMAFPYPHRLGSTESSGGAR